MSAMPSARAEGLGRFWTAVLVAVLLTCLYVWSYEVQPFSDFWNNFVNNLFTVLAAALSAVAATMVWRSYDKDDAPRRIWRLYAVALWLWTIAEIIWGGYNLVVNDVPIGWPDVFWISAYVLFALALYYQFELLMHFDPKTGKQRTAGVAIIVLVVTVVVSFVLVATAQTSLNSAVFVNTFYPVADLAIGLAALSLVRSLRQGILGYAWLGLFAFAISDSLYAWLTISGAYAWSVQAGNALSAIADTTYIMAYLIIALGCFTHWLLLHYGPIFKKRFDESKS